LTTHRLPWRTLIVAVLTIGLLWWFFRSLDFRKVWRAIESAHLGLIVVAVLVTFLTYLLRARRWQFLLAPLGKARFRNTFRATVIGFTAMLVPPGRVVGDVVRPYLLARAEGFNAASALATVIIERVLDLACVLLLFAWFLLTTDIEVDGYLKLVGAASGLLAVAALAALGVGAGHPERLGRWAGRLARALPERAAEAVTRFVRTLAEGLAVMRRPAPLIAAFVLSLCLWLSIAVGIWLTSRAFDLTFPFVGSFLVMMYLVVGVSAPTPGGVGGFHKMYQLAVTTFFGASDAAAGACALVLHAVSNVPISILGLIFMAQDGLTLKGLRNMRPTAEAAEHAAAPPPGGPAASGEDPS
jgi:hypothetical protein